MDRMKIEKVIIKSLIPIGMNIFKDHGTNIFR